MNYLGIEYDVKNMPVLDEDFIPFGVWMQEYLKGAEHPIAVAVEREDGLISVRKSFIRGGEFAEADLRYVERLVKFELWSIGGFRVYLCGCDGIAAKLAEAYSPRYNVSADDAPVLSGHGDRDATVALSDAQAYMAALESAGADVTMRVLADTAHAFILFDYRHDNAYVAKVLADLADHLAARGLI